MLIRKVRASGTVQKASRVITNGAIKRYGASRCEYNRLFAPRIAPPPERREKFVVRMNLCRGCGTVKTVQRPTTTPGVRQDTLRRHNLGLVLREVLEASVPPSRADIAVRTGLTRATVSALVDRLVAAGMLTQLPPATSQRAGRP